MQRRQWLVFAAAALCPPAVWASSRAGQLTAKDLILPGKSKFVRQARLLVDPTVAPERLLILLHGRGEADSVPLALKAWSDLYGLRDAYDRLKHPPLGPILKRPHWEDDRAAQMNATLAAQPFRGFAVVCPVTPNPAAFGDRKVLCRDYTEWLTTELVPLVRKYVPSLTKYVGLDGCSMGGSLALDVFLQKPTAFQSFGTVQAAIGSDRADHFAARFAALKSSQPLPKIHLLTSTQDPYRQANERLHQRLNGVHVANQLDVIPGPHNQPWLRQMGTLRMLWWHDSQG